MKFYNVALFLFILNMTIGLINMLDLTAPFGTQVTGLGIAEIESGEEKITGVLEEQNRFYAKLNWLVENVRLAIQGIGTFVKIFLNATIFAHGMYIQLLCTGGVDCSFGSPMLYFVGMLDGLTYFVYAMALIQWASGRSIKEAE